MRPPCQPVAKCFLFEVPTLSDMALDLLQARINETLSDNDIRAIYDVTIVDPPPGAGPPGTVWVLVFARSYVPCDDAPPPP